jgi:hypothetical protein
MGDWNVHVPAASHPSVTLHLLHLAPALGLGAPGTATRLVGRYLTSALLMALASRVVSQHIEPLLTSGRRLAPDSPLAPPPVRLALLVQEGIVQPVD